MIGRREFITLLGGAAAAWPLAARAQQRERMRRIGVLLRPQPRTIRNHRPASGRFSRSLEQLGWTIGPQCADRVPLGRRRSRPPSQTCGGIGRARAGRDPGSWQCDRRVVLQATRPFRSCSPTSPIRSAPASSIAWRGRAATSRASCCSSTAWAANGWSCSRRSHQA